jgi:hypothetical protein
MDKPCGITKKLEAESSKQKQKEKRRNTRRFS